MKDSSAPHTACGGAALSAERDGPAGQGTGLPIVAADESVRKISANAFPQADGVWPLARSERSGMIRHDEHAEFNICVLKSFHYRTDHLIVDILNGADLIFRTSLMPHLIWRFDMYIDKIIPILSQRFHCRLSFPAIIGVQTAVGALHDNIVHPGSHRDSLQQIDSGDHSAFYTILLFK